MDYKLNPEQHQALIEISKPVLILAGAGSGKTRVITQKIAYLIKEQGYAPWNILAVTFTNKAANEMKERVHELLDFQEAEVTSPYSPKALWITTFHSACGRILRREIGKIGYKTNFTIYDSDDSSRIIKEVIKTNKLPQPTENAYHISSFISRAKNNFESPDFIIHEGEMEGDDFLMQMGRIYQSYEKKLFENNALDFDDLILKTIKLFEDNPETLKYYRELFQYILVDEFQDTNQSQYRLVKLLAEGRNTISVVGDDDQSIYSWRGADISNIINFGTDFNNLVTVKLEQNYRSTNTILDAAYSVVKRNERRLDKKLWSENGEGERLFYYSANDDKSESNWVISQIIEMANSGESFNQIAVFYRMNYQSRLLEEYLRKENIPYRIFGGIKFYERMEIKDLLGYLTVMVNESDALALKLIINSPKRGIGNTTLQKIDTISLELGMNFAEAALYCIDNKMIRNPIKDKLAKFLVWIKDMRALKDTMSISKYFNHIIEETQYLEFLKQNFDNYDDREENIKELGRAIEQYEKDQPEPTLDHFLMEISLKSDIDDLDEDQGCVNLMTVHNSKGLEFKNVFIVGMGEGIFPHYRALDAYEDMEEERRLFYVAVTRAKEKCFLTSAHRQMNFGQIKYYKPSRFIAEIKPECITKEEEIIGVDPEVEAEEIINKFYKKKEEVDTRKKSVETPVKGKIQSPDEIEEGETVHHKDFGEGTVKQIRNKGNMSTVLVAFPDGNRLLILKYANLFKV